MLPVEEALRAQLADDGCSCRAPFPIVELGSVTRVEHDAGCRYLELLDERAAARRRGVDRL